MAEADSLSSGPRVKRYDGKRVALFFGAFLVVGAIVVSTMAYYGHLLGEETRARYEEAN